MHSHQKTRGVRNVVNPMNQGTGAAPLNGGYNFWKRPDVAYRNGRPVAGVNPPMPTSASGDGYNFWDRPDVQFRSNSPEGLSASMDSPPTGNAYYDMGFGGCEPCALNGDCYLPKAMTHSEYEQWVDQPFTATQHKTMKGVVLSSDIRTACANSCPFMSDSDSDESAAQVCKQNGACAWTSLNFNGACGVNEVNPAAWGGSNPNAFTTDTECAQAYGSNTPLPLSNQLYPKCSAIPADHCTNHHFSKFCVNTGLNACKSNCTYDDVDTCAGACNV